MGIFSLEKMDHLYWIGRYVERTYTSTKLFLDSFDRMIDGDGEDYKNYCQCLGIPDIYEGKDDFIQRYLFDEADQYSLVSNINRAFDNAVVMRDYIGSDTLAYLQMAAYDNQKAKNSEEPTLVHLQNAIDHMLAFWGCLDDMVQDQTTRNLVKLGKRVERLDLHLRLKSSSSVLCSDFMKLKHRIQRSPMTYNEMILDTLGPMLEQEPIHYENGLLLLSKLME